MNTPAGLKEMAPFWNGKIKQAQTTADIRQFEPNVMSGPGIPDGLDIHKHGCCLVSEVYGFSREYLTAIHLGHHTNRGCHDCTGFSFELDRTSTFDTAHEFQRTLAAFVRHYQKVHQTPGA